MYVKTDRKGIRIGDRGTYRGGIKCTALYTTSKGAGQVALLKFARPFTCARENRCADSGLPRQRSVVV